MSFFHRLSRRFMAFMSGRNGIDLLAFVSLVVSFILQLLGSITGVSLFLLLSLALYGWTLFRVFSRKSYKREEENKQFTAWWYNIKTKVQQFIKRLKLRKDYKYFKCPQCGVLLRLKRGEGEKDICCPKCQNRFKQKS